MPATRSSVDEGGGIVKDLLACDQAVGVWIEAVGVSVAEFDGRETLHDDIAGLTAENAIRVPCRGRHRTPGYVTSPQPAGGLKGRSHVRFCRLVSPRDCGATALLLIPR